MLGCFLALAVWADCSVPPVMFCEKDKFTPGVLERRIKSGDLPPVPIHDICIWTLPIMIYDRGFPCQDISTLGLKKGLDGDKSSLYYQVLRIVREKHPSIVPRMLLTSW